MNGFSILLYTLVTICLILRGICIHFTLIILKSGLYHEGNPLMRRIIHRKGLLISLNIFTFSIFYFLVSLLLFFYNFRNYWGIGIHIGFITIGIFMFVCTVDFIIDLIGFLTMKKSYKESNEL